jgi:mannose-6-phosphate isomerase-like protein (cupin superfamily)
MVRRVVTGHDTNGNSVVVSDEVVSRVPVGETGAAVSMVWARDDIARFPDDGAPPTVSTVSLPPGGFRCGVAEMPASKGRGSEDTEADLHRTASIDIDIVLSGRIGMELDDGVVVDLGPGDVVVQNGTRHRWFNRGDTVATMLFVAIGATVTSDT